MTAHPNIATIHPEVRPQSVGVLLVHGFYGAPQEFLALQSACHAQGWLTKTVELPGHGSDANRGLHHYSALDFYGAVQDGFNTLQQQCNYTFVIGHSLGGMLALILASANPLTLHGVLTFGSAFEHAYNLNRPWGWFTLPPKRLVHGLKYIPELRTGFARPKLSPIHAPKIHREGLRICRWVQAALPTISVPAYLGHSPYDLVVPYSEMSKIHVRLNQQTHVETDTYYNCGHMFFHNTAETDRAVARSIQFITERLATPPIPSVYHDTHTVQTPAVSLPLY